jgi:hypothetical protein
MSTIKISELPPLSQLDSNTSNSLFVSVDLVTGITGKISATAIANTLFANNTLNVGGNPVLFPNTIAQFSGNSITYLQINNQNFSGLGSSDYIATADIGTNANNYIDLGINNSAFSDPNFSAMGPLDGYLYTHGSTDNSADGNLILGTGSAGSNVVWMVGGTTSSNIIGRFSKSVFDLLKDVRVSGNVTTSNAIVFGDGSKQSTAAASNAYAQAAFALANSASANSIYNSNVNIAQNTSINTANTFLQANDLITLSAAKSYTDNANTYLQNQITYQSGVDITQNTNTQSAWNLANTSVQNTNVITINSLTLTGNLIANSLGQTASIDNFTSNNASFNKNVLVYGSIIANTILGNVFFSNVTTVTTQANVVQWFAQSTSPTQTSGQLWYSANTQTLVLDTDVSGDRIAVSKVLFFRAFNSTGSTIPANSVVRLTNGVTANLIPYVTLADATSSANATVAGFVKNAIANGSYGFVYSTGLVEDLNASGLGNSGDIIFLSTTPGQVTNVAPTGQANTVVQIGRILSNSSINGKIQVIPQLRQAYGRTDGSVLYALANNITASNTLNINDSTGRLNVSSTIYAANGIIYNSRGYPAAQTAITINFVTDTWVRSNCAAPVTITPSNFAPGTQVDVVLTNTSTGGGAAHNITHGCSALNSSVGATTFSLSGTTTAILRYYSFGSDLANTYVAINYQ